MASSREYMTYVMDQLSGLDGVSCRAMMGEYLIYYRGRVVAGVYDDRLLIKPTVSAQELMPNAPYELPYLGAKEMLLVEDMDNREFLRELFERVAPEVPLPKSKKK